MLSSVQLMNTAFFLEAKINPKRENVQLGVRYLKGCSALKLKAKESEYPRCPAASLVNFRTAGKVLRTPCDGQVCWKWIVMLRKG